MPVVWIAAILGAWVSINALIVGLIWRSRHSADTPDSADAAHSAGAAEIGTGTHRRRPIPQHSRSDRSHSSAELEVRIASVLAEPEAARVIVALVAADDADASVLARPAATWGTLALQLSPSADEITTLQGWLCSATNVMMRTREDEGGVRLEAPGAALSLALV